MIVVWVPAVIAWSVIAFGPTLGSLVARLLFLALAEVR